MDGANTRAGYLASIEAAVGGSYRMPDGRDFWMDSQVAQEVARRAADGASAWCRAWEPGAVVRLLERAEAAEQIMSDQAKLLNVVTAQWRDDERRLEATLAALQAAVRRLLASDGGDGRFDAAAHADSRRLCSTLVCESPHIEP